MSLPGVGSIVAAAIAAYLGDPNRFKKANKVVRYTGLDATVFQSGEAHWQGRISKNGPSLLRKLLVQAAHQIVRSNRGPLAQFYRRKVEEIGGRRAVTALARKLLIAAWRLMQTDRLALEVDDEQARTTYERRLRALEREVEKVENAKGTARKSDAAGQPESKGECGEAIGTSDPSESPTHRSTKRKGWERNAVPA